MSQNAAFISPGLSIRGATSGDLASILNLNHHLHESEELAVPTENLREIWDQMLSDSRLFCFVALLSKELIASCVLDIVPNLTRGARPFGVLQNVVTHKDFRGRGFGSRLNRYVLDFAWSKNCYQVLVQTGRPEVICFYERLGFRRDKIGLVAKPNW